MKDVIGHSNQGLEMHLYGLSYRNADGHFVPKDEDAVELMNLATERHPELHVLTYLDKSEDYRIVNYYEPKKSEAFYLYTGNPDPDIEFTKEFRLDDWTPEQLEEEKNYLERARHRKFTIVEIAAMNFSLNRALIKIG